MAHVADLTQFGESGNGHRSCLPSFHPDYRCETATPATASRLGRNGGDEVLRQRLIALAATLIVTSLLLAQVATVRSTPALPAAFNQPTSDRYAQADGERDPGPHLDIARAVPYPADFAGAIPGLGFVAGRFYSLDDEATRAAAAGNEQSSVNVRDLKRQLVQSGWLQRYESRLAAPMPDNPELFSVQISSMVVEYASVADAHAAYTALAADSTTQSAEPVGDESALTQYSGVTQDTNSKYQATKLTFRVGPLLAIIAFADLLNQQPDVSLLTQAAQLVAARAEVVNERQTAPLGSMMLQLDTGSASRNLIRRDVYDVRAGTLTPLYSASDSTGDSASPFPAAAFDVFSSLSDGSFSEARPGRIDNSGQEPDASSPTPTSVIGVEDAIPVASPSATPTSGSENGATNRATADIAFLDTLYAFQTPSDARAWLADQIQTTAADGQLQQLATAPLLGDESAMFEIISSDRGNDDLAGGFRIYARVGYVVSVLEIQSTTGVSANGAAELMSKQVGCIDAGGCASSASLPKSIFGGIDGPVTVRRIPPTVEPTSAPITEPPLVAVLEPTATEAPVQEAIEEPAAPPVEEAAPTEEPVVLPTEAPETAAAEPEAPTESPLPAEPGEATPAPGEEPAAVPTEEPVSGAGSESTPAPAEEPSAPTAETQPTPTVEEPPTPTAEAPAAAPVESPIVGPLPEPAPPTAEPDVTQTPDRDRNSKSDRNRRKDKNK
jgi:hypothetical protein